MRFFAFTKVFIFLYAVLYGSTAFAQLSVTTEREASRLNWWNEARFGMFIHFGVYAVPAGVHNGKEVSGLGEWIMQDGKIPRADYYKYAQQFNPTQFNAQQWVSMAKAAGMKYIVVTAKHHDGFALFDTKASDYSIIKTAPYGKDLIQPLAKECRKQGIRLGLYYSQANDWFHPGGAASFGHWDKSQEGDMDEYLKHIVEPQLREILTNYGDIAELWWDTPINMTKERAEKLYNLVETLQPGIIMNDRLGGGYKGDLTTPEQYVPATGIAGSSWETCMTMNDTWGFKSTDHNWKSTAQLIHTLIEVSSKGGNFLLNVGPEASGLFPAPIVERLKGISEWMKINSESIYGTTASPFKKLPWGRSTKKVETGITTLYLHVFNWPANGVLAIPGLKNKIVSASLIANGNKLKYTKTASGYHLTVPAKAPDPIATVIKMVIKGLPEVEDTPLSATVKGDFLLEAGMVDTHNNGKDGEINVEDKNNQKNIGYWTDAADWISWKVNVNQAATYKVNIHLGTIGSGAVIKTGVNSKELTASLQSTGDYHHYKLVTVDGTLFLEKGVHEFFIKPQQKGWHPINIRSVELKKVSNHQ